MERNEALIEADHWRRAAEDERSGRIRSETERDAARALLEREREHTDRLESALAEARKPAWLRLLEAIRKR